MAEATMRPVSTLPTEAARNLVGVFTDIDDTITTDGGCRRPPMTRWSGCTMPG